MSSKRTPPRARVVEETPPKDVHFLLEERADGTVLATQAGTAFSFLLPTKAEWARQQELVEKWGILSYYAREQAIREGALYDPTDDVTE